MKRLTTLKMAIVTTTLLLCSCSNTVSPRDFRQPLFALGEEDSLSFGWKNIGTDAGAEWGQEITIDLKQAYWSEDFKNFRNLNYINKGRRDAGLSERIDVYIFRFKEISKASEFWGFAGGWSKAIQRDHWVIISDKEHIEHIKPLYANFKAEVKNDPE